MSESGEQLPPTHQPYGHGFTSPSGPSGPSATPEPTLPFSQPYAEPYPQPAQPSYQQPNYQQPAYGAPSYGQPAYGAPAPVQPYGAAPAYGYPTPYTGTYVVDHPSSNTALVLGIVSLVGTFLCGVLVVLGPFAWFIGAKARREIDANPQQYGGRSQATTGMVLGIISTVLMVIVVALIVFFVVLAAATGSNT